jgi:hypothetical protein
MIRQMAFRGQPPIRTLVQISRLTDTAPEILLKEKAYVSVAACFEVYNDIGSRIPFVRFVRFVVHFPFINDR